MQNRRVLFLDYAKGLGILLMLLQHCIPQHNLFRQILQAFIMPLFFIIGGYVWRVKEESGIIIQLSSFQIKKRGRQLGISYLCGGLVLIIFYELLSIVSRGNHSIGNNLIRLVTLQGIDSMWFLPVYFFSEMLFLLSFKLHSVCSFTIFNIISLVSLIILVRFDGSPWPFMLFVKSLLGLTFMSGGYIYARFFSKTNPLLVLTFAVLGLLGAYFNGFASFAELHSPLLYWFDGFTLSLFLLLLCQYLEHFKGKIFDSLKTYGRETLFILCSNNIIIEIIRLIDYRICDNVFLTHGMGGNILMFIFLCSIEGLLILFRKKIISFKRVFTIS